MSPFDALWHLLNFFAPAIGVGMLASLLAKLLWRRDLAAVSWLRLAFWSAGTCAAVLVGGLLLFGRDGKMGTYAAMVLACAMSLWWAGFAPRR